MLSIETIKGQQKDALCMDKVQGLLKKNYRETGNKTQEFWSDGESKEQIFYCKKLEITNKDSINIIK